MTLMQLFSTVLFVDGNSVGYKVYEQNNRLVLNPAEKANPELFPPVLAAKNSGGKWLVEGTDNKELIDQVIEDIRLKDRSYTIFL